MREHQERVIEMQTLTGQGQGHTIRREETEEEEIGATVVASQASQEKEEDMKGETGEEDSTRTREEEIEEEEIFQETEDHLRLGGHSQEEERVREGPVATEREEAGLTPSREVSRETEVQEDTREIEILERGRSLEIEGTTKQEIRDLTSERDLHQEDSTETDPSVDREAWRGERGMERGLERDTAGLRPRQERRPA